MTNTGEAGGTDMTESGAVPRERVLADTFVAIADTLVRDFDVNDLFDRLTGACVHLLGATAAGLMIADGNGMLQVVASSSEAMRELELLEVSTGEGPCVDCFGERDPVVADLRLSASAQRWPRFTEAARGNGVTSVQALPMRLRGQMIGALNIFHTGGATLTAHETALAQALADVATIAILQQRSASSSEQLTEQLQEALNDRIVIEQAKGALAERGRLEMDDAFVALRGYCRAERLPLTKTARQLLSGERDFDDVLARRWPNSPDG